MINTNKSRRGGTNKQIDETKKRNSKNGRPTVNYFNNCTKLKLVKYSNRKAWFLDWIKIQEPIICCLQETLFKYIGTNRLTINWLKKIYNANSKHKKMGEAILIEEKIDFKIKYITRDKETL